MSDTISRSSKEWKASALQKAQEAEAQAQARRQYQKQLEEIQARMREAEEIERENSKQAAIEIQTAKDQEFKEISLVKQTDFRNNVADEVFTRVAQQLKTDDDHKYVLGIVENRPGHEDPSEFKAMLWEAISGNDGIYLRQVAQKVLGRVRVPISEDDINAIDNSVSCFDKQALASAYSQKRISPERTEETATEVSISVQEIVAPPSRGPITDMPVRSTEVTLGAEDLETVVSQTFKTSDAYLEQAADHVKQEDTILDKRNVMDDIENASSSFDARPGSATDGDTNIELTDPLGNAITGHELVPPTPTRTQQEAESGGFGSATRKRQMTEEGTPTSNEPEMTVTPKKRKTTGTKNNVKTPCTKFKEYIEGRHSTEADLLCSKCDDDAKNPRVSTRCYHVYCNTCVMDLKNGLKGKDAHAVMCCHAGCDSNLGAMSVVKADTIRQLKETLTEVDNERDMAEEHTGARTADDEMTEDE